MRCASRFDQCGVGGRGRFFQSGPLVQWNRRRMGNGRSRTVRHPNQFDKMWVANCRRSRPLPCCPGRWHRGGVGIGRLRTNQCSTECSKPGRDRCGGQLQSGTDAQRHGVRLGDQRHRTNQRADGFDECRFDCGGKKRLLSGTGKPTAQFTAWGVSPTLPPALSNIVAVAAGEYHSLALTSNGTVLAWGANQSGESVVPAELGNAFAIGAGWSYSLALTLPVTITPSVNLINPTWNSNSFSVSFQSQGNVAYTLEHTGVLEPPSWTAVDSAKGTGGVMTLTNTSAIDSQGFYRVQLQ